MLQPTGPSGRGGGTVILVSESVMVESGLGPSVYRYRITRGARAPLMRCLACAGAVFVSLRGEECSAQARDDAGRLPPVSVAAPSAPLGAVDVDQGNTLARSDEARLGWTMRTAATSRPWLTTPSLVHQAHLGWLTVDGSYEYVLTNDPIRTRSLGPNVSASKMEAGGVRFGLGFVFGSIGIRVFCAYQLWTTAASPLAIQNAKSTDVGLNLRSYMLRGIRFQPFIGVEVGARVWNNSLIVSAESIQGVTDNLVMMQGALELGFRLRIAERFAVEAVGFLGLGLNAGNAFSDNIVSTGFRLGFGL